MAFRDRIIQPNERYLMPVVDLDESRGEYELYHGCGDCIIEVDGDTISYINYLGGLNEEALFRLLKKATLGGEFYLAACSCYQICEPRRLSGENPAALARAWRLFDKLEELDNE